MKVRRFVFLVVFCCPITSMAGESYWRAHLDQVGGELGNQSVETAADLFTLGEELPIGAQVFVRPFGFVLGAGSYVTMRFLGTSAVLSDKVIKVVSYPIYKPLFDAAQEHSRSQGR